MAGDHDDRRRLARAALAEGWNVRRTEAEARALSERRPRRRPGPRPPRQRRIPTRRRPRRASARRSAARSAPTSRSRPRGTGYKVALTFESLDEALELAVAGSAPPSRRPDELAALSSPGARAISSVG